MNHNHICKDAYIGAPVRAHAHICDYCHGHGCDHCNGGHHEGGCGCKDKKGICEVVVDDAAGTVYIYGNVKHEDYHVPAQGKIPYVGVVAANFPATGLLKADEVYDGEQANNTVTIAHVPLPGSEVVYLNGLKQVEGPERDFTRVSDKEFRFNFNTLVESDRVEIVYNYVPGEA